MRYLPSFLPATMASLPAWNVPAGAQSPSSPAAPEASAASLVCLLPDFHEPCGVSLLSRLAWMGPSPFRGAISLGGVLDVCFLFVDVDGRPDDFPPLPDNNKAVIPTGRTRTPLKPPVADDQVVRWPPHSIAGVSNEDPDQHKTVLARCYCSRRSLIGPHTVSPPI